MNKETALITGVTGQDGSYLAEFLLEKGYNVVGLVRRSTNLRLNNLRDLAAQITLGYGDLIDQDSLEAVIAQHRPSEVYNLAAQSVPADGWQQPELTAQITALGVGRMLRATRKHVPDARFYQASSREIYGGVEQPVFDENTHFLPNNPYGVAKLYGHLLVRNERDSYGSFSVGGILFNHESPRRSVHFVTRKITMAAAGIKLGAQVMPLNEKGDPLVQDGKVYVGNLDAKRDWGYAKEYVVAMWLMLQNNTPEEYVVATNSLHSVQELCEVAFGCVGLDWREHVLADSRFLRPTEITAAQGDYSKIKRELGWEPKTSFHDLIGLMVEEDMYKLKNGLV